MNAVKDKIESGKNICEMVKLSYFPPQNPASVSPIKQVKNQHPIVRDKNFFGASFDTRESPIGEIQSSETVITK